MATEYISGSTMVLQWIYSGGTINFAGDYRTASWSPSIETVDATAGSDTVRKRMTTFKDATASIGLVDQTGGGWNGYRVGCWRIRYAYHQSVWYSVR